MNPVFSFKRFGMLFKKHTVENYKGYLLSLIVTVGVFGVIGIIIGYAHQQYMADNDAISIQDVLFAYLFIFTGALFTSTVFINLGDKRKAIAALILPGSSFEKFLVGWVYSYILFQAGFIMAFYVVLTPLMRMDSWHTNHFVLTNVLTNTTFDTCKTSVAFAFIHSVMLFGAIYFRKMHFVKTAFVFLLMILIIWLLNDQVLQLMIHHSGIQDAPLTDVILNKGINRQKIGLYWDNKILVLFTVLSVMMWCAAYLRLKEKQV